MTDPHLPSSVGSGEPGARGSERLGGLGSGDPGGAASEPPGASGPGDPGAVDSPDRPRSSGAFPRSVIALTAGAILLRLILFLGRGDYLAFDEGWYLLLGRSLFTGEGYSLVGIPHTTLSPLFPILAGATGSLLGDWIWGGRVVAAVSSGLLILPAWAVFRRLAPARTAFTALLFVAVLPTLAPFGVPFYVGADLWVGAEPLLHLFLWAGIALWLGALESDRLLSWTLAGAAFGLGFLARPEAIITWGFLGLSALVLAGVRRSPRLLSGAVLMGVGFVVVASPYWTHLHQVTGRWSLTGRGISATANALKVVRGESRGGASSTIESMLWGDDEAYVQRLYGLDDTGLRLRSDYWGIYPEEAGKAGVGTDTVPSVPEVDSGTVRPLTHAGSGADPSVLAADDDAVPPLTGAEGGAARSVPETDGAAAPGVGGALSGTAPGIAGGKARQETGAASSPPGEGEPTLPSSSSFPSFVQLFVRAMTTVLPPILWPFVFLGLLGPRRKRAPDLEIPVVASLLGTSLAVALLVAVDPRTQLFLAPILVFLLARGYYLLDGLLGPSLRNLVPRPGFLGTVLAGLTVVGLLGVSATQLYLGLAYGSPHHVVARQNRMVAEELDTNFHIPPGPVASWHPALAVYADRDWRVLPYADLPGIIRYGQASGARVLILSAYYPPFRGEEILGTRYLVVPVPGGPVVDHGEWVLTPVRGDTLRGLGRLERGS